MQRRIFVVIHNNYTKYSDIKTKFWHVIFSNLDIQKSDFSMRWKQIYLSGPFICSNAYHVLDGVLGT